MAGRGLFLVLIGPDGVGKTTVARSLLHRVGHTGRYFHFLPNPCGRLESVVPENGPLISKNREKGSMLLGVLRILRNLVKAWIAYFSAIRPAVRAGALVVGDRWLYGYATQPRALKFYGPRWLARIALHVMPKPDMTVRLSAPVGLIRQRKPELSPEEIETESRLLTLTVPDALLVDATQEPAAIAEEVLGRITMVRKFRKYPPFLGNVLLPANPGSLALAGSTLYTPARTRGLAAHRVGRGLLRLSGASWLQVPHSSDVPLDAKVNDALMSFLSEHQVDPDGLAFHIRAQRGRQGFAALAIADGRPVGFIRIGLPGTLDREGHALQLLQNFMPTTFRAPRLIGRTSIGDMDLALHSPVLEGYHRPPKDPPLGLIVRELKDALGSLPRPKDVPGHWEPMHGDLTPWNLRENGAGLSLIDWEAVGWGPPLADQVLYTATAKALGRRAPSGDWDAEAAAFWLKRIQDADNPRDARLRRRLVATLRAKKFA